MPVQHETNKTRNTCMQRRGNKAQHTATKQNLHCIKGRSDEHSKPLQPATLKDATSSLHCSRDGSISVHCPLHAVNCSHRVIPIRIALIGNAPTANPPSTASTSDSLGCARRRHFNSRSQHHEREERGRKGEEKGRVVPSALPTGAPAIPRQKTLGKVQQYSRTSTSSSSSNQGVAKLKPTCPPTAPRKAAKAPANQANNQGRTASSSNKEPV